MFTFDKIRRMVRIYRFNRILNKFTRLGFFYIEDLDVLNESGLELSDLADHCFSKKVLLDNGKELDHRIEFMTRSGGRVSMASYSYNDPDCPNAWFNYSFDLTFEEVQACEKMMAWLKKYHMKRKFGE